MHFSEKSRFLIRRAALAGLFVVVASTAVASTVLIDDFNFQQNATVSGAGGNPKSVRDTTGAGTSGILGGAREFDIQRSAGNLSLNMATVTGGGLLNFSSDSLVAGDGAATYAGPDLVTQHSTFNPFGAPSVHVTPTTFCLGGISPCTTYNFVAQNTSEIVITAGADNSGVPITFKFWVNASEYATSTINVPGTGSQTPFDFVLPFTNFSVVNGGGDTAQQVFKKVGAITVEFDGSNGNDAYIQFFAAEAPEPATYGLIALGLGGLAWFRKGRRS